MKSFAEGKHLNLSNKWERRTIWSKPRSQKKPSIDKRRSYNKGIIITTRSFHDKFHLGSMGMNTKFKVDSHFSKA